MKNSFSTILFLLLTVICFHVDSVAQTTPLQEAQPSEATNALADAPKDGRVGMLMQLGLTREQFRQIRMINQRQRPVMMAAQKRLRDANIALDDAIYADSLAEGEFDAKLKEMQLAHADVFRIRSLSELAVRKVLTPEQLVRFRELREQFETIKRERQERNQQQNTNRMNNVRQRDGGQFPAGRVQ